MKSQCPAAKVWIPPNPIADSELLAIIIPKDDGRRRAILIILKRVAYIRFQVLAWEQGAGRGARFELYFHPRLPPAPIGAPAANASLGWGEHRKTGPLSHGAHE